jgi:rRNA-processing protein EBP2
MDSQIDLEDIDDTNSSGDDDDDDVAGDDDAEQTEGEEEDDIPFSDIDSLASDERGDIIPYQRLTINNHTALSAALTRIKLPLSKLSFSAHQSVTSAEPTSILDVDDDLNRELAFYAQSLSAVKSAQKLIKAEGASFSRPTDYFAEMVKSDEHMGRVKQRLMDDAATKKAASEARRQRDLKKFGKAVQVAKLQERDKSKRDTLEKINTMKRSMLRSFSLPGLYVAD